MIPALHLDRSVVTIRHDEVVHTLLELTAPEAPPHDRAPLDVVLVVDRSGSMSGRPLSAVCEAVAGMIRLAAPTDRIAVVSFDDDVEVVLPLEHHDPDTAARTVRAIASRGSTNLSGGWLKAAELLVGGLRPDAIGRIVLLTDGHANVGVTEPDALATLVRGAVAQRITTSFIGFGDGHDEQLLSTLADAAQGNDYWCADSDAASAVFRREFDGLATVVAQNLSVYLEHTDAVAAVRVLNDFPCTIGDRSVQIDLGDAYGGETRRVVAEMHLRPQHDHGPIDIATLTVRWAAVIGAPALHSVVVPVVVSVGTEHEVRDATTDPRVVEQLTLLHAARAEREAREAAERGDFGAAARLMHEGVEALTSIGMLPDAAQMYESALTLERHEWTAMDAKRAQARSRGKSQGRMKHFETRPDDQPDDPSGPDTPPDEPPAATRP